MFLPLINAIDVCYQCTFNLFHTNIIFIIVRSKKTVPAKVPVISLDCQSLDKYSFQTIQLTDYLGCDVKKSSTNNRKTIRHLECKNMQESCTTDGITFCFEGLKWNNFCLDKCEWKLYGIQRQKVAWNITKKWGTSRMLDRSIGINQINTYIEKDKIPCTPKDRDIWL